MMLKLKKTALTVYLACGGGWTRTTERIPGQIYSLLQLPLCDSPKMKELVVFDGTKLHLFSLSWPKTAKFFAPLQHKNWKNNEIRF